MSCNLDLFVIQLIEKHKEESYGEERILGEKTAQIKRFVGLKLTLCEEKIEIQ